MEEQQKDAKGETVKAVVEEALFGGQTKVEPVVLVTAKMPDLPLPLIEGPKEVIVLPSAVEAHLDDNPPGEQEASEPTTETIEGKLDATPPEDDWESEVDSVPEGAGDLPVQTTSEDAMFQRIEERLNDGMNAAIDEAVKAFREEITGSVTSAKNQITEGIKGATGKVEEAIKAVRKEGTDKVGELVGDMRRRLADLKKETDDVKETHQKYKSHIELAGNKLTGIDKRIEVWDKKAAKLEAIAEGFVKAGVLPEQFLTDVQKMRDGQKSIREEWDRMKVANRKAFDEIWEALREIKRNATKTAEAPQPPAQNPSPAEPKNAQEPAPVHEITPPTAPPTVKCGMCGADGAQKRKIKGEDMELCDKCNGELDDSAKPKEERTPPKPRPEKKVAKPDKKRR